MSTPAKLRGAGSGKQSELTRLKALSPQERAEIYAWRGELLPDGKVQTNAVIRTRIGERFGIVLRADKQLSEFWQWQYRQGQWDRLGEIVEQDEAMLASSYPQVSRDRLRDATIKRMYALADLEQDPKLGLKVVAADLKDSVERRDWERFRLDQKSKLDLALDELAETLKQHPDLMREFQEWRSKLGQRLETN